MKNSKFKIQNYRFLFGILYFAFCVSAVFAQSTNQNFPTSVTTNEISGTIRARDIGDARLTTYFYAFNGNQGDVFINVVTKNLDGDIDIFTAENLRPLTKIRVYSDNPDAETGRVIYLRQPQKLILRIEGRTPTDEPATFRIKFAGSFEPLPGVAETDESKQPEVKSAEESDVRVNSVGTIIEVKPTPTPKPSVVKTEKAETKKSDDENKAATDEPENAQKEEVPKVDENKRIQKPEVIITDNLPVKKEEPENKTEEKTVAEKVPPKKTSTTKKAVKPRKPAAAKTETKPTPATEKKPAIKAVEPAALENIRLIIEFKDGTKIERQMSEILKVSVDKGILTLIAKDGSIGRYSILDVAKMTIE